MLRGIEMSCQSICAYIYPSELCRSNHSLLGLSDIYIPWHDMSCQATYCYICSSLLSRSYSFLAQAFKNLYSLTWHGMLRGIEMSCLRVYFYICPSEVCRSNHSLLECSNIYIPWHDMACYRAQICHVKQNDFTYIIPSEQCRSNHSFLEISNIYIPWHYMTC